MQWLDVCGPPGVGKSTLCDPLWGPRDIKWDGLPPPAEWSRFIACVERLMKAIEGHASYAACRSMVDRSLKKIGTVSRMQNDAVYVQTALAQRGLGIGWRLKETEAIADYFELMPVSRGVVFLMADVETIQARNVARGKDRSFMVPLMVRPREIAFTVLKARRVHVIEIDTRNPVELNADQLRTFVHRTATPCEFIASGHRHQMAIYAPHPAG